MKHYVFKSKKGETIIAFPAPNEEEAWAILEHLLDAPQPWLSWELFREIDFGQDILNNLFNRS